MDALETLIENAKRGDSEAEKQLRMNFIHGNRVMCEAQHLYKKAEQGDVDAQYMVGTVCELVSRHYDDSKQAVYWLQKSAEQGHAKAQDSLGEMYLNGLGVKENREQAVYWLKKAAEQGIVDAQQYLGFIYLYGHGVKQNAEQAAYWYLKAAEQGHATSQYALGGMYFTGDGVLKDFEQTVYWYQKAADQGNRNAIIKLSEITEQKKPTGRYINKNNKILIIESIRDRIADNRQMAFNESPDLKCYEIAYIYMVEPSDLPQPAARHLSNAASFGIPLPIASIEQVLFSRITAQIEVFQPQYLLVYTGFVFRQYSDQVYSVLRRLRDIDPNLSIGRFGKSTYPSDRVTAGVFDRTDGVIAIENTFYSEIFG